MKDKEIQRFMDDAVGALLAGHVDHMNEALLRLVQWFNNSPTGLKERYHSLALVAKNNQHGHRSEVVIIMAALYTQLATHHGGEELMHGLKKYLYAFYHGQRLVKCVYPQICFALFVDGWDSLNDRKCLEYGDVSCLLEVKDELKSQLDPTDRAVQGKMRYLMIECGMIVNRLNKVLAEA